MTRVVGTETVTRPQWEYITATSGKGGTEGSEVHFGRVLELVEHDITVVGGLPRYLRCGLIRPSCAGGVGRKLFARNPTETPTSKTDILKLEELTYSFTYLSK